MAKFIDSTNLGYLISKIKAAFWPKTDVTNVTLADVATTGSYNDLLDKPTIPSVDADPTSGSTNAVSSGGVYAALQGKQNSLTFDTTPTQGSTNPVTSGGIYDVIGDIETLLAAI